MITNFIFSSLANLQIIFNFSILIKGGSAYLTKNTRTSSNIFGNLSNKSEIFFNNIHEHSLLSFINVIKGYVNFLHTPSSIGVLSKINAFFKITFTDVNTTAGLI